jgi:hypothetical protein
VSKPVWGSVACDELAVAVVVVVDAVLASVAAVDVVPVPDDCAAAALDELELELVLGCEL